MKTDQVALGFFLEAQFVHGLAPIVLEELRHRLKRKLTLLPTSNPEHIRFAVIDDLRILNQIRSATAFYVGRHYPIARPKALLGHAHFQQLLKQINLVQRSCQNQAFRSFRIHAAGSESSVFRRLRQQISSATDLVDDSEEGDLEIRLFPTLEVTNHWTVLCRLTPRPLSARAWRVVDVPGALNATLAAAMMLLSKPLPTDRFINLMCGSGTLMIERLLLHDATVTVGCDTNITALASAERNIKAAGLAGQVALLQHDATQLPFPSQSFDRLAADLPWGQLIGDHASNEVLYPLLLQEAARIALPGASFVLITTEVRLLEQTVRKQAHLWQVREVIKLVFKELRPKIYLLQRTTSAFQREEPSSDAG